MTEVALPYNLEAEEHVVGACIWYQAARETVAEILEPRQLHSTTLARILQACLQAHDQGHDVDPLILAEQLDPEAGARMRALAAGMYVQGNVAHHARIVRDHWTRRELIRVGQNIARTGWEPPDPLDDALAQAEEAVYDLTTQREAGELRHVAETTDATFALLDRPGGEITGTPTGLSDLDRATAGLQPGNLIVLAARPGMGKSALALQAALENAIHARTAAIFTLEMSAEEINQRALARISQVPLMRIRTRNGLTPLDRRALQRARGHYDTSSLYIDDTVSARVTDIRARARRLKARRPDLALVIVDYLQLMIHDGRSENRNVEVAAMSRGLKLLARELDVPVMALSQLNRAVEYRSDPTPKLSDLRETGAIEQDADMVLFIHRETKDDQEVTKLTIAKHRNGPTDSIPLTWIPALATFSNHAEGH